MRYPPLLLVVTVATVPWVGCKDDYTHNGVVAHNNGTNNNGGDNNGGDNNGGDNNGGTNNGANNNGQTNGCFHTPTDELCDGEDNDCDGEVNEDAVNAPTWYVDADADGHGDPARPTVACAQPEGTVDNADDCDDLNPLIHPGQPEDCADTIDNDCDGFADTIPWYTDRDLDGYGAGEPAALGCEQPAGLVPTADDCDDLNAAVHPGAEEVCDDRIDNDCDGTAFGCELRGVISATDADAIAEGEVRNDGAGYRVEPAGDVNGDGYDDLLVQASTAALRIPESSFVYLVHGPVDGTLVLSEAAARFDGFGHPITSFSGGGDLDGDGLDDVVIGVSFLDDEPTREPGKVYVFSGALTGDLGPMDASAVVTGPAAEGGAGEAVASSADVTGDGLADLVIAAPRANTSERLCCGEGRVFVVPGPVQGAVDLADVAAVIDGVEGSQWLGAGLVLPGDLNGDGLAGLAVFGRRGVGVRVFHGPLTRARTADQADGIFMPPDIVRDVVAAPAGDLDGDGLDDLLIAATSGATPDPQAGAYLIEGPATGRLTANGADIAFTELGYRLDGELLQTGWATGGFDFNGDGYDDLLWADPWSGDRYLLFYGPLRAGLSRAQAAATFTVPNDDDGFGSVTSADLNGDGYDDLILGNPNAVYRAGAVYIFYGHGQ